MGAGLISTSKLGFFPTVNFPRAEIQPKGERKGGLIHTTPAPRGGKAWQPKEGFPTLLISIGVI